MPRRLVDGDARSLSDGHRGSCERKCETWATLALDIARDPAAAEALLDSEDMWHLSMWPLAERCLDLCVADFTMVGVGGIPDELLMSLLPSGYRTLPMGWSGLGGEALRGYSEGCLQARERLDALHKDELETAAYVHGADPSTLDERIEAVVAEKRDALTSLATLADELADSGGVLITTTVNTEA